MVVSVLNFSFHIVFRVSSLDYFQLSLFIHLEIIIFCFVIQNVVMPAAQEFLQSALSVIPVSDVILLDRYLCNMHDICL